MASCPCSLQRSPAWGLPVPAVLFLELTPPRSSLTGSEPIYSGPNSVQSTVLSWTAVMVLLESTGHQLPVHLESLGHWPLSTLQVG